MMNHRPTSVHKLPSLLVISLLLATYIATAQNKAAPRINQEAPAQPCRVTAQDAHSRRRESTLVITNPASGQVEHRRAQIAELSSGMNYRDEQGQWVSGGAS